MPPVTPEIPARKGRARLLIYSLLLAAFAAAAAIAITRSAPRGLLYWEAKDALVHPGMTKAECDALLPQMKRPYGAIFKEWRQNIGKGDSAKVPLHEPEYGYQYSSGSDVYFKSIYEVARGIAVEVQFRNKHGDPMIVSAIPLIEPFNGPPSYWSR